MLMKTIRARALAVWLEGILSKSGTSTSRDGALSILILTAHGNCIERKFALTDEWRVVRIDRHRRSG